MTQTFVQYVTEWIHRYGTQGRLADKVGLTESAFSRGLKKEGTFGVETLLRFAIETGEPVGKVLRLAGKADIAELLEQVFGTELAPPSLSGPHREVLQLWDDIPTEARPAILVLMKGLAGRVRIGKVKGRRTSVNR